MMDKMNKKGMKADMGLDAKKEVVAALQKLAKEMIAQHSGMGSDHPKGIMAEVEVSKVIPGAGRIPDVADLGAEAADHSMSEEDEVPDESLAEIEEQIQALMDKKKKLSSV